MKVNPHVDAFLEIGGAHLKQYLTLKGALRDKGAQCHFIGRVYSGRPEAVSESNGHRAYRHDTNFLQDGITWFLIEKH